MLGRAQEECRRARQFPRRFEQQRELGRMPSVWSPQKLSMALGHQPR